MGGGASKGAKNLISADADKLFKEIDKNKDNKLSVAELVAAAKKYGEDTAKAWTEDKIKETLAKFDKDKDGNLDKKEWKAALTDLAKSQAPPAMGKGKPDEKANATKEDAEAAKQDRLAAVRASANAKNSMTEDKLKSYFTSFDTDRDGELSLKEFLAMLMKMNQEYEFMEKSGPMMSEYNKVKYAEAGGERPKPPSDNDDDDDDDEEEPHGVLKEGFFKWYPEFYQACEDKKRDEFQATKDLKEEDLVDYFAQRPLAVRNQLYAPLAGPQVGLKDWKKHAADAEKLRQAEKNASDQEALMKQRDKEDGGLRRAQAELGAI